MIFTKHTIQEKWICGHISIAKYQQWYGVIGEFYMAYDRSKMSSRVREAPFKSFDECKNFCEENYSNTPAPAGPTTNEE